MGKSKVYFWVFSKILGFWESEFRFFLAGGVLGLRMSGGLVSADCKRGRKKGAARKLSKSVEKLFDTF